MRREINRYECEGESGKRYTVVEYQNYRQYHPMSGPPQEVPTTKDMYLVDGRDVNAIDDNTFQIVITDEILRRK